MVITNNPALTGSIKNVYQKCFTMEDSRYINFFFNDIYKPENSYAYVTDSKVVASICRIKQDIVLNGRVIETSFLSGLSELPDYRKDGHIKEVIETVLESCNHTELITLASASSEDILKPYGFLPVYRQNDFLLTRDDVKRTNITGCNYDITPIDMLRVYSAFTKRFNGFKARTIEDFINLKKEVLARNGKLVGYYDSQNKIRGYAIIYLQGREAVISECIYLDSTTLIKLINAALQERITIHLYVSEAENLSVLFPSAPKQIHDVTLAKLNSPHLFSRLFNKGIANILEAYSMNDKPLYLNEHY